MISCKTLIYQSKAQQRFITKDKSEGPVCYQLAGNDPVELAEAVKRVTAYGADLIDLNCGCPVTKIRRKGAGSSLLMDPVTLYKLISAMKQNTHVPVSIKIRVQGGSSDQFHAEIVKVVTEAGLDFLVVHGRHWTEHYETPCRHEDIRYFVQALKMPVIGNGDIACVDSLKKMFATGCAGVMLGRSGVGQPWLIGQLMAEMQQEKFIVPSQTEIGAIFIEHVTQLAELLGNEKFAILQARKFAKYYGRSLSLVNKAEFNLMMNQCDDLENLKTICVDYFI
jgi:tRNA-dihydrouridine synthase B